MLLLFIQSSLNNKRKKEKEREKNPQLEKERRKVPSKRTIYRVIERDKKEGSPLKKQKGGFHRQSVVTPEIRSIVCNEQTKDATLTQQQLANLAKVSQPTVSRILKYADFTEKTIGVEPERKNDEGTKEARVLHVTHNTEKIREQLRNTKHKLHFLPPYSSQLNPIENCFNTWKKTAKHTSISNKEQLYAAINEGAKNITREVTQHCYQHLFTHIYPQALAKQDF